MIDYGDAVMVGFRTIFHARVPRGGTSLAAGGGNALVSADVAQPGSVGRLVVGGRRTTDFLGRKTRNSCWCTGLMGDFVCLILRLGV